MARNARSAARLTAQRAQDARDGTEAARNSLEITCVGLQVCKQIAGRGRRCRVEALCKAVPETSKVPKIIAVRPVNLG